MLYADQPVMYHKDDVFRSPTFPSVLSLVPPLVGPPQSITHMWVMRRNLDRDRAGPNQANKVAMKCSSVDGLNPLISWVSQKLHSLQDIPFQPHM